MENRKTSEIEVKLRGFPAYVVDRLSELGVYSEDKSGTIEHIIAQWINKNYDFLKTNGLDVPDARKEGYLKNPGERK